jgi:hypothetical protein
MKKVGLLAGVLALGFGAYKWHARPAADAQDSSQLVENRIWIDHLPRNERDMINVFAAIKDAQIGVFQATSAWKGSFEAFQYHASGGKLEVTYPQSGDKETVRAKARRCDEGGMDYCLELTGGKGVKRYYSQEGWEIGNLADEQAKVRALQAH